MTDEWAAQLESMPFLSSTSTHALVTDLAHAYREKRQDSILAQVEGQAAPRVEKEEGGAAARDDSGLLQGIAETH